MIRVNGFILHSHHTPGPRLRLPLGERHAHIVAPPPNFTWAELHALHGPASVESWLDDPAIVFGGVTLPDDFAVRLSGLWNCFDGHCSASLGGPIVAIDLAHDEGKHNWQRVIFMRDRDGSDRYLFVPEQQLWQAPNKVAGTLIGAGFEFVPGCADQVVRKLAQTSAAKRLVVGTRPGWHGENYVGSGGTIGPRSTPLPVLAGSVGTAPVISADRLELWQRTVGQHAEGNSRLVAALGIALGGIAIGLFDAQLGIGLHLRGLSSLGKTTALRVAASIYGSAHKEVGSWSATDNGLETLAVSHHHRALILDELAQIRPEAAAQAAYLLANGSGRQRASGSGRPLPTAHWQLTFLSSGEISLEEKVAERSGAPQMREGQAVRLIDLPADAGSGHGIYENLYGFASGAALRFAAVLLLLPYYLSVRQERGRWQTVCFLLPRTKERTSRRSGSMAAFDPRRALTYHTFVALTRTCDVAAFGCRCPGGQWGGVVDRGAGPKPDVRASPVSTSVKAWLMDRLT